MNAREKYGFLLEEFEIMKVKGMRSSRNSMYEKFMERLNHWWKQCNTDRPGIHEFDNGEFDAIDEFNKYFVRDLVSYPVSLKEKVALAVQSLNNMNVDIDVIYKRCKIHPQAHHTKSGCDTCRINRNSRIRNERLKALTA